MDVRANSSEDVARVSYLAIRQPAVIRHMERALVTRDGDAFGAGLALACHLFESIELAEGTPAPRLDHGLIASAAAVVDGPARDGADVARIQRWVTARLAELRVVLTDDEERRVRSAMAALTWALAEQRAA
jgi:hypothetical protein